MALLIGITLRVVDNEKYPEPRDALAHDWCRFVSAVLPQAVLVPVLNCTVAAAGIMEELNLDGMIFTGGNDVGEAEKRDSVEQYLLSHCMSRKIPVFGVCRGMQFINTEMGGTINKDIEKTCGVSHAGVVHEVDIIGKTCCERVGGKSLTVNSYHHQGVLDRDLAEGLDHIALRGHVVEGVCHKTLPMAGIQWHPERMDAPDPLSIWMLHRLFKEKKGFN